MDTKLQKTLSELDSKDRAFLVSNLPIIKDNINDLISTELYWVIYDNEFNKVTTYALHHYAIQNIKTRRYKSSELLDVLLYSLSPESIINRLKWSPWVLLEYILIDFCKREKKPLHPTIKIYDHFRGTPELDEIYKIDFLSNLSILDNNLNVGIQLTASTKYQKSYQDSLLKDNNTVGNKKARAHKISNELPSRNTCRKPHTEKKYTPDMTWYVVISWWISEYINGWINILLNAYNKWEDCGYPQWWPTRFIEKNRIIVFKDIVECYNKSLILLWEHIICTSGWINKKNVHVGEKVTYFETYIPWLDELRYDFFYNNWENPQALVSISYFLNKNVLDINP